MRIKLAYGLAAFLLSQNALLADSTKLDSLNINTSAFDAQIKSVSSKQLEEEQASDVKDILKSLPSVTVDGNARYGQKVYVRGLEDKFANITVDGAKLGGQLFHHSGDQTIDASLLKITAVELGPNSALSGPGVINGSFKYETLDPSDFLKEGEKIGGKVSIGYETARERRKGSVAVFGKVNEKFEFVGMGSIADDGTLHLGNGTKEANKESKLQSGLLKFVFKPDEYNTIKLSYNKYEDGGNRNISGEKIGSDTNDEDYSSISRDTISLKYEYKPDSELINIEANTYTNKQYMIREANDTDPKREYTNYSSGFDLRNMSLFGIHKLTYGIDYNHEEQELEGTTNIKGGETDNIGVYFEDEIAFDKAVLTLGSRYDNYKLGGIYSGTFNQLSPKMQLKYYATKNLTLRTAYGRIFKGPALGETLMLSNSIIQDSNTVPQTGNNYEIGFDYDLTKALNADDAIIGLNIYRYDVDNYAHLTKNNTLSSQGDVVIWGSETMFSYRKDKFSLNASHTYTDGEQINTQGIEFDPKTANIHVFKLGLNYQLNEQLKLNYNSQFVPGNSWLAVDRTGLITTTNERSGYGEHDINLTYKPKFDKNATLNFGIANIFDKDYVRHTAFGSQTSSTNKAYELGRNFKFQLSYRF